MRVAVIGAGAAGITAAYQLSKGGAEVDVFEASDEVGGLARTIERWGQKVDLGPHRFFSNDARVNRLWLEVMGRDYRMIDRLTRIYYRQRFFDYPLRASNALWNMGLFAAARCLASYCKEKVLPSFRPEDNETFESWVVSRFGQRLFQMFFQSYSEKLWGIPCEKLDADFAAQRIKKFSLGEAIKSALGLGKHKHKTLVDQFAYPVGGTGMVYERMAEQVRKNGGRIHLHTPVRRLLHDDTRIFGLEFPDGTREMFDHVISTMPLTLMVKGLDGLPPHIESAIDQLRFRNTILVYLHVDGTDLFPDQWLYIHSPDLLVGRVTNFRNWVPELYGPAQSTILALEYWANDDDALWKEEDAGLIARAEREIRSTGLIGKAAVLDGNVFRIRRCYPVYARGYKALLRPVIAYLNSFQALTVIGRYGAFKYNNQDHSILMGILAAENILHGKKYDLWAINTDYDSYQESATITATGLVHASKPAAVRDPVSTGDREETPVHAASSQD
ncbi:MAG TPA: FAD-dependent oxidoreductase [Gemmataceae bacterium]|jgi:protoporphyrinogen oxidase